MGKALVTMSPKRRRLPPASSGEGFFDQLPESMIEEILLRLPFSSVLGSRCVSKLWCSLTNSRYFIQRWENHHAPFSPLGILLQNSLVCTEREFFPCFGAPEIKFSGFSLDFLPGSRLNGNDPITVTGSCEDLLLCCNMERFQSDYFIVNPITGQWIALPPTIRVHKYVLTGLVCKPASIPEAKKGGELRYRVVRIPVYGQSRTEFNVEIFSSEDGQWNEYAMTWAEGLETSTWSRSGVACNGILYWKFERYGVKVMRLDPFNPKKKGIRVIQNVPDIFVDLKPNIYMLGICQGKLRMTEVLFEAVRHDKPVVDMKIWELENGEANWRLVRVVLFPEILADNSSIGHPWEELSSMTLAFHPSDGDIIYFQSLIMNKVICCNLKRMSLEIVRGYDLNKFFDHCVNIFPFQFSWWPTPVPALPKPCI